VKVVFVNRYFHRDISATSLLPLAARSHDPDQAGAYLSARRRANCQVLL